MHGIHLRIIHTGLTNSSVYLADVDAVPPTVPPRNPGPVYVPRSGSITLIFTSAVCLSFERGNIRKFITSGHITTEFVFGDEYSAATGAVFRQVFLLSPGNTINETFWLPYPIRIWSVQCYSASTPSTAGNYTLHLQSSSEDLLEPAAFDLTSITATTAHTVELTLTTDLLEIAADTPITITVASDNPVLTGDSVTVQIWYGLR